MTTPSETIRILLVEDDAVFVGRARKALDPFAMVRVDRTGSGALSTAAIWRPHVIVFDLLMDDLDGFTFFDELSTLELDRPPFILCTTDGRGAGTRIRPLPGWRVGTLLRSSSIAQIRIAVMQAAQIQHRNKPDSVSV